MSARPEQPSSPKKLAVPERKSQFSYKSLAQFEANVTDVVIPSEVEGSRRETFKVTLTGSLD
jgi:hypothetical protein